MIRGMIAGGLTALVLLAGDARAKDVYVPDDYATIQQAIILAAPGDTVIVRPGTWFENIDFSGKAITVRSEKGPAVTVIDGRQAGSTVTFWFGEGPDSVLDGFTLTNGNSLGMGGGGIYCFDAKPTITNNIITQNSESGIHCFWNGLGQKTNNTISANALDGINCVDTGGTITGNRIVGNGGSGIWLSSAEATIANNTIGENGDSGICCINGYFDSEITNNIIYGNTADKGGGIYWHLSGVVMTNNTIYGNTAGNGGGIYCEDASSLEIVNTIMWANTAGLGKEIYADSGWSPSNVTISYSDVEGGQQSIYVESGSSVNWGTGMIDDDPQFSDPQLRDFHLTSFSPCRNQADNQALLLAEFDFEGDPRDSQGMVDMGADESHTHLYHIGEVVVGNSMQIRICGKPGNPIHLALGSSVREPGHSTVYGDILLNGPLNVFFVGTVPPSGIQILPVSVPTIWNPGEHKPMQALVGLPGKIGTELTNLMILSVE